MTGAALLLVVLGTLALKLALAALLPGPWLFSESTLVARAAAALATDPLAALRGPAREYTALYPALLAPAFLLRERGDAHAVALAINAFVSTSTLIPVHAIARRMLPPAASLVVTVLVALLPPLFVHALALSADNLFVPLFWWGTLLLVRLAERDRPSDALAAGLVLGLLPAVKLTGFGVLAAAALMVAGMTAFHRVGARRAAAFTASLLLPQVIWLVLRVLMADPDRGLFGLGPGVGEALVATLREGRAWTGLAGFFVGETTYFLAGAYVAWLAFSVYLVTQYRTWRSRSVEGLLLLWTFLSAAALAAVTVVFLYPIASSLTDPEQRARAIYGRFIEVLFPAFFILGTRGMLDFAWKEDGRHAPRRTPLLILLVALVTAVSFYPLTDYAVSSPFRRYAPGGLLGWTGAVAATAVSLGAAGLALVLLLRAGRPRAAAGLALAGVVGVQALAFAVSVGGVVRGARERDAALYRIGHRLARSGGDTRVAWDRTLGFGDQFFAYRFWSGAEWDVISSGRLETSGADYAVTRRELPLPLLETEANGVRLYRLP